MAAPVPNAAVGPGAAFLFPGQGSQSVGMGRDLYEGSRRARDVFDQVDAALGRPLTRLLFEGPEEELRQTVNAQPAIMAVSLACIKAMEEQLGPRLMPQPMLLAGHSLGEYTALAAGGVLDVSDTARLVQRRGELMQDACDRRPGSMAAIIGLDLVTTEEIARETGTYVSNFNTPEQIVISGDRQGVANAMDLASARGAKKTVMLRVSGAFHSALMEPARQGLTEAIRGLKFSDPSIPIVANCTAKPLTRASALRQELVAQISSCVRWKPSVDYMVAAGVSQFIEVGPGTALTGMVKRIQAQVPVASVGDLGSIQGLRTG